MLKTHPIIATLALVAFIGTAQAEMPRNVRCAIMAQKAARDMGREYQATYNRKFELCMVKSMPQERQTTYFIEKLKPYVAVAPGPANEQPAVRRKGEVVGTWVRVSPNVWVLED
jgi:hypothetical protein